MHVVKIGLAFAVVGTLMGASVRLSFAQGGGLKINQLRVEAIRTCSTAAAKLFIYRACMAGHSQQE
ncbi:MAG: hypothetical protein WBD97_01845 [Pseudolabrys sp.]